jgi:transposase
MDGSVKEWSERTAFAGFDWAHDHHDVVVEDRQGTVVEDFRFEETADGWKLLKERLSRYPDVAVAIETCSGAVVERLLEAGFAVYPVNPKAAKRYRERKVPSGTKTDRVDAWSLADA